jgi:hypothetical protein
VTVADFRYHLLGPFLEPVAQLAVPGAGKGAGNTDHYDTAMPSDMPRKFKFIGCEIMYREACRMAAVGPHMVDIDFLRKGLHDLETDDMVSKIQETIDAVDPAAGYEAILLGYARCNDGLVGVRASSIPLVIPRAHDCITLFFGSRDAFQRHFDKRPGTYYLTTGWCERNVRESERTTPAYGRRGVMANLGLTESYEQMVAKYGQDNADYIIESLGGWESSYTNLLYLEMGTADESRFIADAKRRAQEKGWEFEHRKGDWTLFEKLFLGQWDEDFVVVQPGQRLVARNDGDILDAQ